MGSNVTRRGFLRTTAASVALASTGAAGLSACSSAPVPEGPGELKRTASLCNGCTNKCALWINTKDGVFTTLDGNPDNAESAGTLCARGHGFAQMTYSADRLTQPMKRMENGDFEPISWEDAYAEIGEKLTKIIAENGPESFAFIRDGRPSIDWYAPRFVAALGSANIYTHGASCNLSLQSAYKHTIGGGFSADLANSKMIMFIGRSYADGITPGSVKAVADLSERGDCKIVMVDPRYNNTCNFADQWIPIKPGTDLALVLAMSHVLITEELYDKDFVRDHVLGFYAFKKEVEQFTPQWASEICGVDAEVITTLAHEMAEAAPAAVIEPSWRAAFGCAHQNSFMTGRAVAAFNALLGNYGNEGGALLSSTPALGSLPADKFPTPPAVQVARVGSVEYPLAAPGMGTCLAALKAALDGKMKAMFFYQSNAAKGYANPKVWEEGLANCELVVDIDVQMSETALLADYVLPECSYLERMEVVTPHGGKHNTLTLRDKAIEIIHPETKPVSQIFTELSAACGVGEYFDFTIEELVEAQLASVGASLEEIREKGSVEMPATFEYGTPESFATPSGKVEFYSVTIGRAGLSPVITWQDRKVHPAKDEFYFVGGKQAVHSHTMTTSIASLMDISRTYNLSRLWMNASDCENLGIKEGDTVEISSSEYTDTTEVHVTERLMPGVVFMPTHYGTSTPYYKEGYDYGICTPNFVPFDMEPGTGATMSQEFAVKIKKVGA